jgi:hypothetical protein
MAALTKHQRESVEQLARNPCVRCFYEEESWSGQSWTLRYREEWSERSKYGYMCDRYQTGLVFSVVRPDDPDPLEQSPATLEARAKFEAKVTEARALFTAIRQAAA